MERKRLLKPSKFNTYFSTDKFFVFYNSLSGAIAAVPSEYAELVKRMLREGISAIGHHKNNDTDIVQMLVDGRYLVDALTDEDEMDLDSYISKYNDGSLGLTILPTEQCNFRCVYCYETFERGAMQQEVVLGIKNLIKKRGPLKQLHISWFGGEPLLAKDTVIDIQEYAYQMASTWKAHFSSSMTTNGSLLDIDTAKSLIRLGIDNYQITIDGVGELHDKKRAAIDGQPSFERIVNNIQELHNTDLDFSIVIRINFDKDNVEEIPNIINYFSKLLHRDQRYSFYFHAVGAWGGSNDDDLHVFEQYEAAQIIADAMRLSQQAGFPNNMVANSFRPNGFACYASNPNHFVVGSNGTLYKCTVELDSNDRNIIGKLHSDGELEIDQMKHALWIETNGRSAEQRCWTCAHRPSCHGAICPKAWLDGQSEPCPPYLLKAKSTLSLLLEEHLTNSRASGDDTVTYC